MNYISNEELVQLDSWIANHVPDKNLFTTWVHLTTEYSMLRQQRDAALKLADKWERDDYGTLLSDFSNEIRAIFAPKE